MSKSDNELIAEFLANKGATKIAEGTRAYDPKDIYRANREGGKAESIAAKEESAAIANWDNMQDTAREAQLNGQRVTGYDSAGNIYTTRGRY